MSIEIQLSPHTIKSWDDHAKDILENPERHDHSKDIYSAVDIHLGKICGLCVTYPTIWAFEYDARTDTYFRIKYYEKD